jgi:hypothetical protein
MGSQIFSIMELPGLVPSSPFVKTISRSDFFFFYPILQAAHLSECSICSTSGESLRFFQSAIYDHANEILKCSYWYKEAPQVQRQERIAVQRQLQWGRHSRGQKGPWSSHKSFLFPVISPPQNLSFTILLAIKNHNSFV